MINVRFQTALQMMLSLALAQREGVPRLSSAQLADGIGSNPTLIRRQLAPLVRNGLVSASKGRDGGVALARSASSITVAEVYQSVLGGRTLLASRTDTPHKCLVSSNVEEYFASLSDAIDEAVVERLAGITLGDALGELSHLDKVRTSLGRGRTRAIAQLSR